MMSEDSPAARTRRLLDRARYLTLATVSADGLPWAAVLQYAWLGDPLRLLFGSARQSWHGRHLAAQPLVSGSLFVAGDAGLTAVDGAQFSGRCRELDADGVARLHAAFYDGVLPDPQSRARWTLPPSALLAPADHRLYVIKVERWWLVDTRTWEQDRIDRRMEVPLAELALSWRDAPAQPVPAGPPRPLPAGPAPLPAGTPPIPEVPAGRPPIPEVPAGTPPVPARRVA